MFRTLARGVTVVTLLASAISGLVITSAQAQVMPFSGQSGVSQGDATTSNSAPARTAHSAQPATRDMGAERIISNDCAPRARVTGDWVRLRNGANGPVMAYAFRSDVVSAPIYDPEHYAPPGWYVIADYTQGIRMATISAQYLYVYRSCAS